MIRWPRALRHVLLPLLAVALLATQAAGLWHRIEHSGASAWTKQSPTTLASTLHESDSEHDTAPKPGHDCAAIDSQTLTDAPPVVGVSWCAYADVVQEVATHVTHPFIAVGVRPFQARAPPPFLG